MKRRAALILAACVVTAGLLAGCGITADGAPREISQDALPASLQSEPTTTTTMVATGPGATVDHDIFFARQTESDFTLAKVSVPVQMPSDANPEQTALRLIDALVKIRTETLAQYGPGIQNKVPLDTTVHRTEMLDGGILVVDFSKQLVESIQGDGQLIAIAQIIFTATEAPGVNGVILRVDGVDQAVRVEGSTSKNAGTPVFRTDFERLNNGVTAGQATAGSG